jgi:cystathionine beta-lyase/cystathionine gamma-synthase
MPLFGDLPCGARIPSSVHAVSVSLPLLSDLIGYEEQRPEMLEKVRSGYPRFHTHPFVSRLLQLADERLALHGRPTLAAASVRGATLLCQYAGIPLSAITTFRDIVIVALPDDPEAAKRARSFLQHTGSGISSRLAEDLLIAEKVFPGPMQEEETFTGDAETEVRDALGRAYGTEGRYVHLGPFGMNAIYAAYRSLSQIQEPSRRREWIQFGWLFMDTIETLRKLHPPEVENHAIHSTLHLEMLETLLRDRGGGIAGLFTEVPSNPLMQTPDVERLRELADRYGFAVVIDATLGTPHNVDVLQYADAVVESLTKYASGSADLMMGAVVVNPRSRFAGELQEQLPRFLERPWRRDVARLAFRIGSYRERMQRVNKNTMALVEFFSRSKGVKRVRWAYEAQSLHNFEKVHRAPQSPGGIMTLELNVALATVYDRLRLAKGPSLGADFTLVGPYLYHAHYPLVSTEEGRSYLHDKGLDPNLLRVSAGIEETSGLIAAFSEVL